MSYPHEQNNRERSYHPMHPMHYPPPPSSSSAPHYVGHPGQGHSYSNNGALPSQTGGTPYAPTAESRLRTMADVDAWRYQYQLPLGGSSGSDEGGQDLESTSDDAHRQSGGDDEPRRKRLVTSPHRKYRPKDTITHPFSAVISRHFRLDSTRLRIHADFYNLLLTW